MQLDDISIKRSAIPTSGRFHLQAEVGGYKFDGFFDDFGGFLTAVRDFGAFVALRNGKLTLAQANKISTRDFAPNPPRH